MPLQVGEGGEWSGVKHLGIAQFRAHLLLRGCVTLAATCSWILESFRRPWFFNFLPERFCRMTAYHAEYSCISWWLLPCLWNGMKAVVWIFLRRACFRFRFGLRACLWVCVGSYRQKSTGLQILRAAYIAGTRRSNTRLVCMHFSVTSKSPISFRYFSV